jgi:hypothetical protein
MTMRGTLPALLALAAVLLGGSASAADAPAAPTIVSGPPAWTQSQAAQLGFTSPDATATFVCQLDGAGFAPCSSPADYQGLAEGTHVFRVEAVTADGTSAPSEWSWTVDLTPPSLPGDVTVEATSPLGTVVTFAARDSLDSAPAVNCTPSSGSAFPLGKTDVSCTAHDAAGNETHGGSFTVTVVDTTPPALAPHANKIVDQDSPSGATVGYKLPAATDAGDASPVVSCSPEPGSTFAFGTTHVKCSAKDASGNKSAPVGFDVIVQRGSSPAAPTLTWDVGSATNRTSATFSFKAGARATLECKLDRPAGPGAFAPCSSPASYRGLKDGSYVFTVRATNSIGNVSESSHMWLVDTAPPLAVRGLAASFGSGWIGLSWRKHTDIDFSRVVVWRKRAGTAHWVRIATERRRTSLRDPDVRNDVRYVYALRSIDRVGNRSPSAKVKARASKILKPAYDALRDSPPRVDWMPVRKATYFNMQVWREGRKVLSVWPQRSSYRLRARWTYGGRRYSLGVGRYLVYVWPGFGPKSAVRYGSLLGWTAFRIGR